MTFDMFSFVLVGVKTMDATEHGIHSSYDLHVSPFEYFGATMGTYV